MSAMDNSIGPYLYGDRKAELKFAFDRTFTMIISSAYNAGGLVGSERNGIVILDEDNRQVVLDRHEEQSSGYFGPGAAQVAEFERIKAMDWKAFSQFCHDHPRYRRGSPDIDTLSGPDVGNPTERAIASGKPSGKPGRNILPDDMNREDWPFEVKHTTRDDILVFLANHHSHVPMNYNNGGYVVAWDIKVRNRYDESGSNDGEVEVDASFDERWNAFMENQSYDVFNDACNDGLSQLLDGDYCTFSGEDNGAYKFGVNGRSDGHLVLTGWNGSKPPGGGWASCEMAFDNREDYIGWLKDLDTEELGRFYRLVVSVDETVKNPEKEISYQISFRRECMEEIWRSEMDAAPKA